MMNKKYGTADPKHAMNTELTGPSTMKLTPPTTLPKRSPVRAQKMVNQILGKYSEAK